MTRILLFVALLVVLGAGGVFIWSGLVPPQAQSALVTHDVSVTALESR